MERVESVGGAGDPHSLPPPDEGTCLDEPLRQIGVAGPKATAVIDSDRRVADHHARKRYDARRRRSHQTAGRSGQVDTPVAGVLPGRSKEPDNLNGQDERRGQAEAESEGSDYGQHWPPPGSALTSLR